MGRVLINNTNAKDNLERASLSFVVANAALSWIKVRQCCLR